MKRKLISFDVFKKITEASLTNAQHELAEAADVLSKTLGTNDLKLFTFGESDATYQAQDGSFVHASYKLDKEQLVLENIQQLVVEEETEKKAVRETLSNMIDSLLENNDHKATELFESYLSAPSVRRNLLSETACATGKAMHKKMAKKKCWSGKKMCGSGMYMDKDSGKAAAHVKMYAKKMKAKDMKEWADMCRNIDSYLDYKQFSPIISESKVKTDEKGNVVAMAMPTTAKQKQHKVIDFNWKTLDSELKVIRGKMKLAESTAFCKAMADLKRANNISDNKVLEETLEAIVSRFPDVLFVTEAELSNQISTALEAADVTNFDDRTCEFMAEAILRTAHNAYSDRVRKIATLAGVSKDVTAECQTCEDSYSEFKQVADSFFAKLDESDAADRRVYADLYNSLNKVRYVATELRDEAVRQQVESYMKECASVLNRQSSVDLTVIESINEFIKQIAEANLMGAGDWEDGDVHTSINGDNPRTSWNAKQAGSANLFPGDWSSPAPVSDGKTHDNDLAGEMQSGALSNHVGSDEWPQLSNPYVPAAGDFKMKEKNVVDDPADLGTWQSNDTWPKTQNPYVPAFAWEKDKYNMTVDHLFSKGSK